MLSATQNGQPHVLVVDDEPLVRMFTAIGLRDAGFVVVEACTAEEALAEFDARAVLAVITDIEMSGLTNGYHLPWRVRELQPGKPVGPETLLTELRHAIDASREG